MSFWQFLLNLFGYRPIPVPPVSIPVPPVSIPVPPVSIPVPPVSIPQSSAHLFALLNAERVKFGLAPFIKDFRLDASAQWHCNTMVLTNTFSRQCPGEAQFDKRIKAEGYVWSACSENIAAGQTTAEKVVSDWMNEVPPNDGHRRDILGPYVNAGCGVSFQANSLWKWYWTTDFGTLA